MCGAVKQWETMGNNALYLSSVLLLESRPAAKHTGLPLKSNIDNTLFKYILGIHAHDTFLVPSFERLCFNTVSTLFHCFRRLNSFYMYQT